MSAKILFKHKGKLYGANKDLKDLFVTMIRRGINCHDCSCRIMFRKKCVARGTIEVYWGDPENSRAPPPCSQTLEAWQKLLSTKHVSMPDGRKVGIAPTDNVVIFVSCDWIKEGFDLNQLPLYVTFEHA